MSPRDDHRASGRLAPPRPVIDWGMPAAPQPRLFQPQRSQPNSYTDAPVWPENDGDVYSDTITMEPSGRDIHRTGEHAVDKSDSRVYSLPGPVEHDGGYYGEYGEDPSRTSVVEIEPVPPRDLVRRAPREEYTPPPPVDYEPEGLTSGTLSMQERQQLLMHTIQLYDDEWKLAGIRANQRKNWLQGYLTPRNKKIELKEAISRNYVLIITIDNKGNTNINEPRKPSLWRRLMWWLFGG